MRDKALFAYLKRKDGSEFEKATIENWYIARAYVLDKLKDVVIGPESSEHLHVEVVGDSDLMLSVVRQVALSAHYANYEEESGKNRTKITLVSDAKDTLERLRKEEYLCNLLDYCKYTIDSILQNKDSYIDIELEFVENEESVKIDENSIVKQITEEDVNGFRGKKSREEIEEIDTSKAVLAGRMYDLGVLIDNLPAEDIHCASRYAMALDVFQHDYLKDDAESLIDGEKWKKNLNKVKNGLSNVFCADCFESRAKGIGQIDNQKTWETYNEALSKSEHARWVAEKLIMGFRPLTEEEHVNDEQCFGEVKKSYRDNLKNNSKDPAHIDLCSYRDLRRINPDDLKKDSFLMLAIPIILKKLKINV